MSQVAEKNPGAWTLISPILLPTIYQKRRNKISSLHFLNTSQAGLILDMLNERWRNSENLFFEQWLHSIQEFCYDSDKNLIGIYWASILSFSYLLHQTLLQWASNPRTRFIGCENSSKNNFGVSTLLQKQVSSTGETNYGVLNPPKNVFCGSFYKEYWTTWWKPFSMLSWTYWITGLL